MKIQDPETQTVILKKMNILKIFLSFFKIGVIGFGGGSALIPVVEREIVEDQRAMTDPDYLKHTVVANITPGALPAKLGATCGYQLNSLGGSLVGSYSVMLPGVILTILLMSLFASLGPSAIQYVNYASVGITAFIVFLLVHFVIKTVKGKNLKINLLLTIAAFVLTGGKEVRHIVALTIGLEDKVLGTPLFDISTIDLIILTFFVIILLERLRGKWELPAVLAVCLVYALTVGKLGKQWGLDRFSLYVLGLMILILVLAIILRRESKQSKTSVKIELPAILSIVAFILIPVVLAIVLHLTGLVTLTGQVPAFLGKVFLSTITSFGGGEAYVSVADGIFVQGGYIEPDLFYTRLVPVANALPGPILIKIAAGIGFGLGAGIGGNLAGWLLGLLAASIALGACCSIAMLVLKLYDSIGQSRFIANLKLYILPVICGMLLSTCTAMLNESMKIAHESAVSGWIALPALIILIVAIWYLYKRFHLHDIILLILPALVTLGIFLVI